MNSGSIRRNMLIRSDIILDRERTLIEGEVDVCEGVVMPHPYSQRMQENTGTILLKNRLEIDLIKANVVGPKILDVGSGLESCLAPRHIQAMQSWRDEDSHDQETLGFAQEWYRQPVINELLEYKGVPLGPGMEYLLMQNLLSAAANMPDKII